MILGRPKNPYSGCACVPGGAPARKLATPRQRTGYGVFGIDREDRWKGTSGRLDSQECYTWMGWIRQGGEES